jgi:hypothetical protein
MTPTEAGAAYAATHPLELSDAQVEAAARILATVPTGAAA